MGREHEKINTHILTARCLTYLINLKDMIFPKVYAGSFNIIVVDYGQYIYLSSDTCAVWPPVFSQGLVLDSELATPQENVFNGNKWIGIHI